MFSTTDHHRIYLKGSHVVTLPAPDADGSYDAGLLDQCLADPWVPIAGRLTPR